MAAQRHRHSPARILALFALIGAILLGVVAWGGWRLLEQERAFERQWLRERLENEASLVAREMEGFLADWNKLLIAFSEGDPVHAPAGTTLVALDRTGVVRHLGEPLLFQPVAQPDLPTDVFSSAELLEFREGNSRKASALYRELTRSGDDRIRAGALIRLGRCLRKDNRLVEALDVYGRLADLGGVQVAGFPALLLARRERMALFDTLGDKDGHEGESALLVTTLGQGSLPVDRAAYEFFREFLSPDYPQEESEKLALAEAVTSVWSLWLESRDPLPGRLILGSGGNSLSALLHETASGLSALIGGCDAFMSALQDSPPGERKVRIQLLDPQGQPVWGEAQSDEELQVIRTSLETGLPWSVRFANVAGAGERSVVLSRRNLLLATLALVVLVLATTGYTICRAVLSEMRVARLQSDFVAAVSHEFRTPLTALCHLSESLDDGRVEEERRPTYYRALAKESRRLKEMVENLLDFARMESEHEVYRRDELSVADLVRSVLESFQDRNTARPRELNLETPAIGAFVRGDAEALGRAVRNLLDNAEKYSPPCSPIRVVVSSREDRVFISVEDQGPGIAKAEQRQIFHKFVRGSSANSVHAKGTGIGLAMVRHIVAGHGGRITVDSEPGRGSRFTIDLPLKQSKGSPDLRKGNN